MLGHFVYNVGKSTPNFSIIYYIAVASLLDNNPDLVVMIHTNEVPTYSLWWNRLFTKYKERIEVKPFDARIHEYVNNLGITDLTHQADVIRLLILQKYGGWYLDLDQISINPLPEVPLNKPAYFGEVELDGSNRSIVNRFMYHPSNHEWTQRMLDLYSEFYSDKEKFGTQEWVSTSILKPSEVWRDQVKKGNHPITLLNPALHDPITWLSYNLQKLFMHNDLRFDDCIGFHLCETVAKRYIQNIDLEHIMTVDTTFTHYTRRYLVDYWDFQRNRSKVTYYTGYKF